MKKITKRFVGLLVVFAVLAMSITVHIPTSKANEAAELTFTFENGIPPRTVYCDGTTNIIGFLVNDTYYNLSIDSHIIDYAYCDKNGTLWIVSSNFVSKEGYLIYWTNYELEGDNMTPHYFYTGYTTFYNGYMDSYSNYSGEEFPLPTFDDLKNYIENGVPVPGSKPKPTIEPEPSTNPDVPSTPQVTSPTSQPTPSPEPTPQTSKPATIKKVVTYKNTIKIINSNNEVIDEASFNKKKSTLSYKGKKITKVKSVWFTKKGSLVYLKTNAKAYYLNGKKSKLIKSKVLSVKTSKKFATALKLKSGKIYKLK